MSHYKLLRSNDDLEYFERQLQKIINKGPSGSRWWQGSDVFKNIIQPKDAAFDLERNFNKIRSYEIAPNSEDNDFFSLHPQWMYWFKDHLSNGSSGARFRNVRSLASDWYRSDKRSTQKPEDKDKLIAELIDSSAMLPTNVTIFRLSHYLGDGGASKRAKLRFLAGYAYGLQQGYLESQSLQMGVVAALPRNIESKEDHRDLWSNGIPPREAYSIEKEEYVPLQVILDVTDGFHLGEFESDGKIAL